MTAGTKLIADNRRARHEYHLLDRYEAGLALTGTEVKSLRDGKATLQRAFGDVRDDEVYLVGLHIPEYTQGTSANHDPDRERKLLLHRREIDQLVGKVQEKGLTLIPTRLYWKNGRAKVELALARGKDVRDKRRTIADRDAKRQMERALKSSRPRLSTTVWMTAAAARNAATDQSATSPCVSRLVSAIRSQTTRTRGCDRASDRRREGDRALGRRSGERPLDDGERDERGAEQLGVEGRLGQREAEEVVERVPGRGQEEHCEDPVRDRIDAQNEGLRKSGMRHLAAILSSSGGDPVSTGSVLRKSCKPRSPVGLVKQPGTKQVRTRTNSRSLPN